MTGSTPPGSVRTGRDADGALDQAEPGTGIRFDAVSKTYRTGAGLPVRALAEVSIVIPAGQSVAVTGPSGSGKSTLLHLAGAMDEADSGTVTVGSSDLGKLSNSQRADFRRHIGFVFQRFHLLPALTACDNVAAPVLPFRTGFDKRARARELLAAVGLAGREHDLPSKLSGGQQQRVAIARALIGDPPLLLADEPTGNLDSATGREVLDLLFALQRDRGLTLVLATHDPVVAGRCDRVIELRDGQLTADSKPTAPVPGLP
ncbi:MAG TPA: ABC transporter ATP-binding protein [Streptosporangiaceae bacterium]|nr:ABC transporter ATP-binding protein [Streptosporangiaceae bacterium]